MDFIESLFGISPDGGSGVTEGLFVIAALAIAALVLFFRRKTSNRAR